MRKRIEGTVSEENYEWFMSICAADDRGPSYVLDRLIASARIGGYKLSGQAPGLAKWMREHAKAEA